METDEPDPRLVESELEKSDSQSIFAGTASRLLVILASGPSGFRFALAQAQSHQERGVHGEVAIRELPLKCC